MKAQLIRLLQRQWVSPLDALNKVGCMSLSQRCGEFRRAGINITSRWVQSNGKRYKAYRIVARKGC